MPTRSPTLNTASEKPKFSFVTPLQYVLFLFALLSLSYGIYLIFVCSCFSSKRSARLSCHALSRWFKRHGEDSGYVIILFSPPAHFYLFFPRTSRTSSFLFCFCLLLMFSFRRARSTRRTRQPSRFSSCTSLTRYTTPPFNNSNHIRFILYFSFSCLYMFSLLMNINSPRSGPWALRRRSREWRTCPTMASTSSGPPIPLSLIVLLACSIRFTTHGR